MLMPLTLLLLTGLGLFYFQNLVLYPHVQVRLLSLLVFAVGWRTPLPLGFSLALLLGLTQDAYALTPMGLHLAGGLLLVAAGRLCRRGFLLNTALPQVLAASVALTLEELAVRLMIFFLGRSSAPAEGLGALAVLEVLATALLAPLMFGWLRRLEQVLRRLGWQPAREAR